MNMLLFKKKEIVKPKHPKGECDNLFCERRTCVPSKGVYRKLMRELKEDFNNG